MFHNQIVHSSKPHIQQLDLRFIGIHCNESNIMQAPQLVQAICSPQLVQIEQLLLDIASKPFCNGHHSISYLCNDEEMVIFSTTYSLMKGFVKTFVIPCGCEKKCRFDNLEDMCSVYSFILRLVIHFVHLPNDFRNVCKFYQTAKDFEKRQTEQALLLKREALRDKKMKERRETNKIEKPRLVEKKKPLSDITNITRVFSELKISKERK